ncbi:MAG TPA: Ig-like domain-containing protein [Thermoanaerobaculia bacterium]|nr:Ig-like domain-containing protein [Thermoanaerobaculia bacterium]
MRSDRFPRGGPSVILALGCAAVCALAGPLALAQRAPQPRALDALVKAPAGFVATIAPQPLAEVAGEVDPALLADVDAFRAAHGPAWSFFVDRRSGGMALVEGQGIPWVPGAGNALDAESFGAVDAARLESLARGLMATYPSFFAVPAEQLELAPEATRQLGDQGQFWNVAFRQVAGGVPVANTHVVFRVSHGNLVQLGVDRVYPVTADLAAVPQLGRDAARAVLGGYLGGLAVGDTFSDPGTLLWVLRGTADQVGWRGAVGEGWQPHLVWRFVLHRDGLVNLEALVDALGGQVLRLVDANDYASVLRASVHTRTNCSDPANCVPGDIAESPVTMPHAVIDFVGGTCSGDGCYSNGAGAFDYPPGALSAVTSLQGRYFRLIDVCGPIAGTAVAPGNIDLGTSDPSPLGLNTDCAFAIRQSAPDSGLVVAGTGDTHSARTMYYHLNLINEKSRYYLPENEWLKGADGTDIRPQILTNVPGACNAFWSGGIDALVFMQRTPALFCNNTGEGPDVGLHEFGHGLDEHDGTGTAPESATGEAMGDTFALLQGQSSCIGAGLRLVDPSDPSWSQTTGYGSRSRLCSGVRDLDYTRYCRVGAAPLPILPRPDGCVAPADPDSPNGARSGPNPPPEPAGAAGTPARWNHMIASAPAGVADGFSNFYACGGPETTGCAGPLNHGCHCESLIASQSNWDLARLLIADEFGGDVYSVPPGPAEVSGWQYLDRLWYLTRDLAVSGYSVVGDPATDPATSVVTNGCGATDWYSTYRLIDDDNGNLADGTPHADLLFAAFDLHGIACGTAAEAANQATGCPAPLPSPQLAACGGSAPVHLDWGGTAAGAGEVRVLRNTIGCDFGFTPLGVVAGDQGFFIDEEVAPGVPYYYSVQPVGANPSCYGQASNCLAVTPQACAATALPAPGGVTATATAANQVEVSWAGVAGAGSYKVVRVEGGCAAGGAETTVGVVAAPGTSFTDTHGIEGGSVYGYRISTSETACASCTSQPSACVEVEATGDCLAAPRFAGLERVVSGNGSQCSLSLEWSAGTATCGTALTYTVHRSTDPAFTPGPANAVATGVTGTSFTDGGVRGGTEYTYVVRAVDAVGNTDANTVRRSERAVGPLGAGGGQFADDAGDTGAPRFQPRGGATNTWAVRAGEGVGGSAVYATTPAGNYPDDACMALESETIHLGTAPTLSFRTQWAIEPGWDGAIVQVASADSGFSQWTKLDVGYPGVVASPAGDTACGDPGLADGQLVFNGNSLGQYLDFSGSLAPWAGQAVRVRFLFGSDGATNDLGLFVDDLVIDDVREASQCVSTAVNQVPVAVDDEAQTARDTAVTIAVLANDSDPDDDPLTVVDHGLPDHGSASVAADGRVTYHPNLGFGGVDGFDYVVTDRRGGEAWARVTVEVH